MSNEDKQTVSFRKCVGCGHKFTVRNPVDTRCVRCRFRPSLALDEQIKLCNCAGCGRELLGDSMRGMRERSRALLGNPPPMVAGRIKDRPYCRECLALGYDGNARPLSREK